MSNTTILDNGDCKNTCEDDSACEFDEKCCITNFNGRKCVSPSFG